MPPKRKSTSSRAEAPSKRVAPVSLSDSIDDDNDRFGEKFIQSCREFHCVYPGCDTLADTFKSCDCKHTFFACKKHLWSLSEICITASQCLFCRRLFMHRIAETLKITTEYSLLEDSVGERAVQEHISKLYDNK